MPVYLPDGTNGTEITYLDGSQEQIAKRLCWVLEDLLFYLRSSKTVLTRQSRNTLGKKARRVPLILKQEFTLVPVKGREKIGQYDAVTGYAVLHHVQSLLQENGGLYIRFTGGAKVRVYDNARVLKDKIHTTQQLLKQNQSQPSGDVIPDVMSSAQPVIPSAVEESLDLSTAAAGLRSR